MRFLYYTLLALCLLPQFTLRAQYDSLSPAITLDQPGIVDFDTIVQGDTVRYTYWYTNTGKSDLHIKQAWPSCGCTTPTYSPATVKPGERGRIDIEFHSKNFTGPVEKFIIVLSNAPEVQPKFKAFIITREQQAAMGFVRKQDRNRKMPEKAPKVRKAKKP